MVRWRYGVGPPEGNHILLTPLFIRQPVRSTEKWGIFFKLSVKNPSEKRQASVRRAKLRVDGPGGGGAEEMRWSGRVMDEILPQRPFWGC